MFERSVYWLAKEESGLLDSIHRKGECELGNLYFDGSKVSLDLGEAKRWMAQAAASGDDQAVKWITDNCPEKPEWLNTLLLEFNKSQEEPKDI